MNQEVSCKGGFVVFVVPRLNKYPVVAYIYMTTETKKYRNMIPTWTLMYVEIPREGRLPNNNTVAQEEIERC